MLNGGYVMVSKNDTDLYKKLNNALTLGKPVLFYENENTCYYIDSIAKDGTDIVLTKGGKTITIEADGDITESGEIQNHLYEYYVYSETNDYGFNIQIPFDFGNGDITISDEDTFNEYKDILQTLFNYFSNEGHLYSGLSDDMSYLVYHGFIYKSSSNFIFRIILCNISDMSDKDETLTLAVNDGVLSYTSGKITISKKQKLF